MNESHSNQSDEVVTGPDRPLTFKGKSALVVLFILMVIVAVGTGAYYSFRPSKNLPVATITNIEPTAFAPATITMSGSSFIPATISVAKGQAVIWTNSDTKGHLIASDPFPTDNTLASLNSDQVIAPGDSYAYVFTNSGTYTYHDNLDPSIKGTVIVK